MTTFPTLALRCARTIARPPTGTRYGADARPFDEYQPWPALRPLLKRYIAASGRALNVGCENSPMSDQLLRDGFVSVLSVDASDTAIRRM
jgi:hypothetical protein